ncbi:hypothetical protein KIPB_011769, partial [Kipferlia bialata]|eukprot:g11769.t1
MAEQVAALSEEAQLAEIWAMDDIYQVDGKKSVFGIVQTKGMGDNENSALYTVGGHIHHSCLPCLDLQLRPVEGGGPLRAIAARDIK